MMRTIKCLSRGGKIFLSGGSFVVEGGDTALCVEKWAAGHGSLSVVRLGRSDESKPGLCGGLSGKSVCIR